VISNLKKAFPDLSDDEIFNISKGFYKNLTDIIIEGIKGISLSEKEIVRRYKFTNPEISDAYYKKGKDIMIVGSHYTNWEWGVLAGAPQVSHKCFGVYKPLSNKYIDAYFRKGRVDMGMNLVPIKQTRAAFDEKQNEASCYILLADQSPSNIQKAIWVNFLGIETACLHGPEEYAKKHDLPILYVNIQRIKRGFYEVTYIPLIENSQQSQKGQITSIYMGTLEKIIKQNPKFWLWSHRRWKHKR
jgi:KDO2-lipid IV(A) lauroyltransferase